MPEKTNDYSIFKKHISNRDLEEYNVKKIMVSIQTRNLLEYRPILIDKSFRVIDGQHRLEAARRLGLPVYYEVSNALKAEDIILLNNNQKTWSSDDYLNFYCQSGKQDYEKFKQFMNKHKLTITSAMTLCFGSCRGTGGGTYAKFKNGSFMFPEDTSEIEEYILKINQTMQLLNKKIIGNKSFLKSHTIQLSLIYFFGNKELNYDLFIKKLSNKIDAFHKCSQVETYILMFKAIYNYKNQAPIE